LFWSFDIANRLAALLGLALDQFRAGFVASLSDGTVLFANETARWMFEVGWPIRLEGDRLRCENAERTALLLKAIYEVSQSASISPDKPCERELPLAAAQRQTGMAIAIISPLKATFDGQTAVAIHIATHPAQTACALPEITQCFGLTKAETRTLDHLAKGHSVTEAADALSLSVNTVKTHLQNIFAKTGTSRQKDLLKVVDDLRSPLAGR